MKEKWKKRGLREERFWGMVGQISSNVVSESKPNHGIDLEKAGERGGR